MITVEAKVGQSLEKVINVWPKFVHFGSLTIQDIYALVSYNKSDASYR